MGGFKNSVGFGERMNTAAAAKKARLKEWSAAKADPNDPAVIERQAARQAIAAKREEREAARKAAKIAREAQAAIDQKAAKEASEAQASADAAAQAENERLAAEHAVALEAERKAARDARYAARKARKN